MGQISSTIIAEGLYIRASKSKTAPLQDFIDWCAEQEAKVLPQNLSAYKNRIISDPKKLHRLVTMVHEGYSYSHIRDRFKCGPTTLSKTLRELPPHLR